MTNLQLQLRFTQQLGISINKPIDIRTIEIEYYLNEGLNTFIKNWYSRYEMDENARKRLAPLVSTSKLTADSIGTYPNSQIFTLPDTCRYVVQERCDIKIQDCNSNIVTSSNVTVKPIKLDYYNLHIKNPFKMPYKELLWRIDLGNRTHTIIYGTDTIAIEYYYVTYLRNHNYIHLISQNPETTSCEILPEYHNEIVEEAVRIAIQTLNLIPNK